LRCLQGPYLGHSIHSTLEFLQDFSSLKRFSFKKQISKPYILEQSDVIVRNFASHSANLQLNFQTKKYNRGVQIPGAMSPGLLNFGRWSKMLATPQYRVCFMSTLGAWEFVGDPKVPKNLCTEVYYRDWGALRPSSFSVDKISTGQSYVK